MRQVRHGGTARLGRLDPARLHTPRMRLAVRSSKRGVGKTTAAADLAVALAGHGRVLAVDTDPQDSPGRAFGVVAKGRDDSLAALPEDLLREARAVVRHDSAPGVDVLPAHPAREPVAVQPAGSGGLVTGVRRALRPLLDEYDHIVPDTRGDLGGLTLSAVCAADTVPTVFTSDPCSALGVGPVRLTAAFRR